MAIDEHCKACRTPSAQLLNMFNYSRIHLPMWALMIYDGVGPNACESSLRAAIAGMKTCPWDKFLLKSRHAKKNISVDFKKALQYHDNGVLFLL